MSKTNITSEEKQQILKMHSDFKKTIIKEQNDVRGQLQQVVDSKFIDNVVGIVRMNSTNPLLQYAIKQESRNTPGKFRYFFMNGKMAISGENGLSYLPDEWKPAYDEYLRLNNINPQQASTAQQPSGQQTTTPQDQQTTTPQGQQSTTTQVNPELAKQKNLRNWMTAEQVGATQEELANPAMYEMKEIGGVKYYRTKAVDGVFSGNTQDQLDIIRSWTDFGWETPNTISASEREVAYKVIASPKSDLIFPEDLIMHMRPDVIDNMNKQSCASAITNLFNYWDVNKRMPNGQFAELKLKSERCSKLFRKQGELGKASKYIEVLTGQITGGRSKSAPKPNNPYRLNNDIYKYPKA